MPDPMSESMVPPAEEMDFSFSQPSEQTVAEDVPFSEVRRFGATFSTKELTVSLVSFYS